MKLTTENLTKAESLENKSLDKLNRKQRRFLAAATQKTIEKLERTLLSYCKAG
jgi:hypothetical protein